MSRALQQARRLVVREALRHVLVFVAIVAVATIVAVALVSEPAAFLIGAATGAAVSAVALVPALRRCIDRWLDGEDC